MDRRELRQRIRASKSLSSLDFRPLRHGSLPRPLKELGGPRISATKLLDVGNDMKVVFLARSGATLERRAFFAYLFEEGGNGLLPLVILHYHPSHKGLHLLVNCETGRDYTGRQLPGAPELNIDTPKIYDPDSPADRIELAVVFCTRLGISPPPSARQLSL
jgi:hypothetical protein